MRTVRSFGAEEQEVRHYSGGLDLLLGLGFRQAYAYVGYMFFVVGAPLLVTVAVLFFGAHMVLGGRLKPGDMVAFVFYQQSLSDAISGIGDVFTGLMSAAGAADKVFELIDRAPKAIPPGERDPQPNFGDPQPNFGDGSRSSSSSAAGWLTCETRAALNRHLQQHGLRGEEGALRAWEAGQGGCHALGGCAGTAAAAGFKAGVLASKEGFVGGIVFDQVSVVYPSRPTTLVLKGLSFSIEPGQVVALVGESGSGKSSCIALLQRWYDPCAGQVLVDGAPIHEYTHAALHKNMALVGQEPVLYARSIRDNICYGCDHFGWAPEEAQARVEAAARQAKAHDFIAAMEKGYDTLAGERGGQLSGGQKQRIAIARALVRSPSVLLLDEATSALDTASEAQVQAAIDACMHGRTVVIIAHRLSTVRRADKIVVLSNGRVVEEGSHDELVTCGGAYAALVAKQLDLPHTHSASSLQSLQSLQRPQSLQNLQTDVQKQLDLPHTHSASSLQSLQSPQSLQNLQTDVQGLQRLPAKQLEHQQPAHTHSSGSLQSLKSLQGLQSLQSLKSDTQMRASETSPSAGGTGKGFRTLPPPPPLSPLQAGDVC
jgi:ATP-binding cassette subfamily B (MDR/TAP) protein 9